MALKKLFLIMIALIIFSGARTAHASVDFNCYCLDGSLIPTNYPLIKKINTADDDSCNQECANVSAKYYSFSNVAHVGTTAVTKTPVTENSSQQTSDSSAQTSDTSAQVESGGLVPCGRSGQSACTLCHLISGFSNLVTYLMKLLITITLAGLFFSGVMYIVSAGDDGMMKSAKGFATACITGFAIVLGSWLIINVTLWVVSANFTTVLKNSTAGSSGTWYSFTINCD